MAWLQVDQTIRDHHKICDAAEQLGISPPHLTGCLVLFWLWALDNAPAGNLGRISPAAIARAAQWDGDKLEFIAVLQEHGLLDQTADGLAIHDWQDYAGNLIERRKADAERKRRARAEKRQQEAAAETSARTGDGHPLDVLTQSRVEKTRVDQSRAAQKDLPPQSPSGEATGSDSGQKVDMLAQQFEEFWELYPKKTSKAACLKAWKKLNPSEELRDRIAAALEAQRHSDQWQREGGRYIPSPLTWLNGARWDDEPAEVAAPVIVKQGGTLATLARMYSEEE